jgi:hypothetical protein
MFLQFIALNDLEFFYITYINRDQSYKFWPLCVVIDSCYFFKSLVIVPPSPLHQGSLRFPIALVFYQEVQ